MNKTVKTLLLLALILTVCAVFVACSEVETYSVSIAEAEHGKVFAIEKEVQAGEKVVLACMPNAGYKLDHYTLRDNSLDGAVMQIDGNTFVMPQSDVEVSAVFSPITYTITYIVDDEVYVSDNPETYTVENGDITLNPPPQKEDFEFASWHYYYVELEHWNLDEWQDYKVDVITQGTTGDLTVYARYYNVPHEIVEDKELKNGSVYASFSEADVGEVIFLQGYVNNDMYELLYFTVDGERIESDTFIMPNHSVVVSAVIRPIEYTITYELDGGENAPNNSTSYNAETENFELKDAVKDGYIFTGWYCYESGLRIYGTDDLMGLGNVTLWAEFYEISDETDE